MSDRIRAALAAVIGVWALAGCGQTHAGSTTGAPAAPLEEDGEAAGEEVKPQPRLGDNERRVKIVVLPGDAVVEVDGAPVRRRSGLVELSGKVGKVFRLRVLKEPRHLEREVTIPAEGSPPPIDLNARPTLAAGAAGAAGSASATPPRKNALLNDKFE